MSIFPFSEIFLFNSFSSQESFDDASLAKQKEIQETDPTYEEKMVCNIWDCVQLFGTYALILNGFEFSVCLFELS